VSTNAAAAGAGSVACAADPALDPGSAYRCIPSVALRPESFGALDNHFGTPARHPATHGVRFR